jgi:transcriptional regulator with XRE-family HTH domain
MAGEGDAGMKKDEFWDPLEVPIGETIYRLRTSMGLSQLELQGMSGVHRNTLLRIERGERPPSIGVLHRISSAMGVEMWRVMKHAQKVNTVTTEAIPAKPLTPFHVLQEKKKNRARYLVNRAIKNRRLTRQPCEVCGEVGAEAHHEDYSKPLDVVWLCRPHHGERHRMINSEAENGCTKSSANVLSPKITVQ